MLRRLALSILTLSLAASFAAPAFAEQPRTGENLYVFGHEANILGQLNMGIVGLGYRFNWVPQGSKDMSWQLGIEYGQGMNKITNTRSGFPSTTNEIDATSIGGVLERNHYYDCCDFYCGPTLYYETISLKVKDTGDPDQKYKGMNTYGLGGHFGGGVDLAKNVKLFGEAREIFGMSSYDETRNGDRTKWSAWRFIHSYQGGLSWSFGH